MNRLLSRGSVGTAWQWLHRCLSCEHGDMVKRTLLYDLIHLIWETAIVSFHPSCGLHQKSLQEKSLMSGCFSWDAELRSSIWRLEQGWADCHGWRLDQERGCEDCHRTNSVFQKMCMLNLFFLSWLDFIWHTDWTSCLFFFFFGSITATKRLPV